MRNLKLKISLGTLLVLILFFAAPTEAYAVIQNLNNQTGQSQSFQNDSNVTISSSNDIHSIIWQGLLPLSRGGTGASSFTDGSIPFIFNGIFSQDNSNLLWDNTNKRLGIGTATPSSSLEVAGNAKATSLTSTNDSTINGLTVGLGGGSVPYNTAIGVDALSSNTTGPENVAIGFGALSSNTVAGRNTAVGSQAMPNGGGSDNTAVGRRALYSLSAGSLNSAFGVGSLGLNTSGSFNTAVGAGASGHNTTGSQNVAIGQAALSSSTTGGENVAIGQASLLNNLTGGANTAIGQQAGRYQAGGSGLTTATSSVYIGFLSRGYDNNDNNSIVIGANAIGAGANKTVIGNSSMTDVYFGSSSANANTHAKKMYLGSSSIPGCIIMGDSDGSGVTYLTVNDGVLTASSTQPSACQ